MKKIVLLMAVIALSLTACVTPEPSPAGLLGIVDAEIPWDGGTLEVALSANCNWQLEPGSETGLVFEPSSGTGDATVKLTLPANKTNEDVNLPFKFSLSTNDGQYNYYTYYVTIPKPSLTYGGKTYAVVYLEDGNYWMAEPLAYLPDGVSASDDPATGTILYPYTVTDGAVSVLKDDASIKANGYLYKADAFLATTVNAENCQTLEGKQGICPEGWHVPTWTEWYNLVGASNALADGSKVADNANAIFWDSTLGYASVANANTKGFNFVFSGTVANNAYQKVVTSATTTDVTEFVGKPSMSYFACSTGILSSKGDAQMFAPMSTFSAKYMKGRLSLAYANTAKVASQVRCVKGVKSGSAIYGSF